MREDLAMKSLIVASLGLCLLSNMASAMQVTALHPLMADLARQVGGNRVEVIDLVGEGGNPHQFQPRPSDLKKMSESSLILAAGKGMEPYLDRIRAAVGEVPVLEVGNAVPSLKIGKDQVYVCCPHHANNTVDPHWWHGIENMRRAARVVAKEFGLRDPSGKEFYQESAAAYSQQLGDLKKWAKGELKKIPRNQRKLITSHNAFGYFAHEFGFQVIAVAGLNREQDTTPQQRAKTISSIRDSAVAAVFPEYGASDKELESVAKAAAKSLGPALISDGNGRGPQQGFLGMIRYNVNAITRALTGS